MASELNPDQVLRAVAALEAAWPDDDALTALIHGGQGEQPLAVSAAQPGASRMQNILLVVTGIARPQGTDLEEALAELRKRLLAYGHGGTEHEGRLGPKHERRRPGDRRFHRRALEALLSFTTDGDAPQEKGQVNTYSVDNLAPTPLHHHVTQITRALRAPVHVRGPSEALPDFHRV